MKFNIIKKVIGASEVNAVSARTIHVELGLKSDFSTWIKKELRLFTENNDYIKLHKKMEANNATLIEYIVTTDVAKHLCMLQRNSKGMEARQYFIDAEQKSNLPVSYIDALKALIVSEEARELAIKDKEDAEANRDLLIHQNKKYTASELAGELGMKSAIKLNKRLHEDKVQYKVGGTWKLYAKYESLGYADYKQVELDSGRVIYQMRWTGIGRDFILNRYKSLFIDIE